MNHDRCGVGPFHGRRDENPVAWPCFDDSVGGLLGAHFLQRDDAPAACSVHCIRQSLLVLVALLLGVDGPDRELVLVVPLVLLAVVSVVAFVVVVVVVARVVVVCSVSSTVVAAVGVGCGRRSGWSACALG